MQKLENLEIDKVAFVEEGDNRGADVLLFKRKPQQDPPKAAQPEPAEDRPTASPGGSSWQRFLSAIAKGLGIEKSAEKAAAEENTQHGEGTNGDDPGATPTGATPGQEPEPNTDSGEDAAKQTKGVDDMKIDKSKLTPEELTQLEAIEKKAGIQEEPTQEPAQTGTEDIYKGLHPAVREELQTLRKRADEAERRELETIAKKYELLGKKPVELAKTLKSLKDAGGTAYDDMIAVLDSSLEAVEKSGAFSEVGKSGHGSNQTDAWTEIEKHAAEIRKVSPDKSLAEAIDIACAQHPELVADYEGSR
ncbi:MAG: hypothetical protein ACI4HO_08790 [Ruminococcus sp.]